jgi:polysaccharide deacetylase 2 family uncharacterized protein YibQ
VKPGRRILFVLIVVAALVAIGVLTARQFPKQDDAIPEFPRVELDSLQTVAWRKANGWLFRDTADTALTQFRERFLLPYAVGNGLEPRAVRKRGDFTELTFPRGKPVHTLAYELEQFAPRAGFTVIEGREVGNLADKVEYMLQDAAGNQVAIRLVIGEVVVAGSFRMALVITDLGRASEADRRAWAAFPVAVTLVYPDTVRAMIHDEGNAGATHDVMVELPMEPTNFPVVKPGPRALFIDDSREETETVLRDRLDVNHDAVGFATKFGDRAIENPGLMNQVLTFIAARELLFLDLTGSPRTLTAQVSLATGATGLTAIAQEVGSQQIVMDELLRRTSAAQRSGEGVWVLRHTPGLPEALAKGLKAHAQVGASPRWVTLRTLKQGE